MALRDCINWFKRLVASPNLDSVCSVAIFLLSMSFGWLLASAYPDGLVNAETAPYWHYQKNFQWLSPNSFDWTRTPPYAAILVWCANFPHPTNVNYWLNTLLFSLSCGGTFILGRSLFSSLIASVALALGSLVFEFASMRTFYANLFATADPFFAEIVHLGVVLALVGWLRMRRKIFFAGYALLGLAVFTKPVGLSLLPAWLCFAFLVCWRQPETARKKLATVIACLLLLLAPVGLWSLRNFYVYGYPKCTANGGISLLLAAFPTMTDSDQLFTDRQLNADFIDVVRKNEQENVKDVVPGAPASSRADVYEDYLFAELDLAPPFVFLMNVVKAHPPKDTRNFLDSETMFKLDSESVRLARYLIWKHPSQYLQRVFREYIDLFSPLALPPEVFEAFNGDPEVVYNLPTSNADGDDFGLHPNFGLYPIFGLPNAKRSDKVIAKALAAFQRSAPIQSLLNFYYRCQFYWAHVIFLGAVVCCLSMRIRGNQSEVARKVMRVMIVVIMLFLTAASNYFVVSLTQVARLRYALAGGDLELHLMFVIVLCSGICWLRKCGFAPALDKRGEIASGI